MSAANTPDPEFPDPRDRVLYSPIISRPKIKWPGGARLAFWVSPNVEHYEYVPSPNSKFNMFPRTPHPDVQQYAFRDYGNRVGFWRMAQILDRFEIRATVSLNLAVLDHYPELRDAMVERDWSFMSHGIYNTRPVYGFSLDEEREMLRDSVETLRRHTGKPLRGMLGPALSMTLHTPDLMTEAGLNYHTDWIHDDQPVPIRTRTGRLVSVPYNYELNDGFQVPVSFEHFAQSCKRQFDRLWQEGADSGRAMCVALHPFLVGQPHFAGYLEEILDHVRSRDQVWHTTADEIADYYIANCFDEYMQHAASLLPGRRPDV